MVAYVQLSADHPERYPTVSVYFAGCDAEPKCAGCHNPELHDPHFGIDISDSRLIWLVLNKLRMLERPILAILGGEPLAAYNRNSVLNLTRAVKNEMPHAEIILFTFRTVEDIVAQNLADYVKHVDTFVLGRFDVSKLTGSFPASANQTVMSRREFEYELQRIQSLR